MARWWKWRPHVKRRHATFKELGVPVAGTGLGNKASRGRYGTTWSDPDWNRTHRERNAERYEDQANGLDQTDNVWDGEYWDGYPYDRTEDKK